MLGIAGVHHVHHNVSGIRQSCAPSSSLIPRLPIHQAVLMEALVCGPQCAQLGPQKRAFVTVYTLLDRPWARWSCKRAMNDAMYVFAATSEWSAKSEKNLKIRVGKDEEKTEYKKKSTNQKNLR